jgi:peptidoglycan/LPS O-acetylase OafA/YrhL
MSLNRKSEIRRIAYLDGVRGCAAMIVFMNHLLTSFVPAIASIHPHEAQQSLFATLALSPFAVLCSGNFAVCIFFVLSGYVLSDFCERSRLSFPAQLARRYCRFAVPMLLISTFAWLLLHFGLYSNLLAAHEVTHSAWLPRWYNFNANFFLMLKETLYQVFVTGEASYNCNLWTMQFEFIGSAYVFSLFALFKQRRLRCFVIIAFISLHYQDYYLLFAWGVMLYDFQGEIKQLFHRFLPSVFNRAVLATVGFFVALYLGGFPIMPPELVSPWYPGFNKLLSAVHWHTLGAMLLILFLLQSRALQMLFSTKTGLFFGKISFVLYLIHVPVICSLTAWLIYATRALPYYQMLLISTSITIISVILISKLLYRYIDQYTTGFSRQVGDWIDYQISFESKQQAFAK